MGPGVGMVCSGSCNWEVLDIWLVVQAYSTIGIHESEECNKCHFRNMYLGPLRGSSLSGEVCLFVITLVMPLPWMPVICQGVLHV